MLTQLTDTLTHVITNLYVSTGLIGILLAMAIESCCIPLPSEIVMPLAGIMFSSGKLLPGMNTWVGLLLIALAGSIGCLIGSIVAYGIGYAGGRPLMLKYGRYLLISQHDADKADHFFQRWGSETAFFSRLLPIVRTYISLPAGISKMPFAKFCVYTFLGSFPWCVLLAYVGTVIGGHLDTLGPIFHGLDVFIVIAVVALVALYIWRHIRNDNRARAALETGVPGQAAIPQGQNLPQQQWGQQQPQQWQQPPLQQPQWNQSAQQQWQQPQPQQQWGSPVSSQSQWSQPPQQQSQWSQQPPVGPQPGSDNGTSQRR